MTEGILFALLGLVIGSFLNVVIYRLPRTIAGEQLGLCWPGSHCPACKTPVKFYHNIPLLGWLCLWGRCAYCKYSIPVRYFLVELLTASLFALIVTLHGVTIQSAMDLAILCLFIPMFIIDLTHLLLPDRLTYPLLLIALIMAVLGYSRISLPEACFSAVLGYGIPWLLDRLYVWRHGHAGMGMGDMKLFAGIGAWLGLEALMHIMMLSSSIAIITITVLRKKQTEAFPFGPYLIAATLVIYFFTEPPILMITGL